MIRRPPRSIFFNDTAPSEIYPLSLPGSLPITPHLGFLLDITHEPTPWPLATFHVPENPGDFCGRGGAPPPPPGAPTLLSPPPPEKQTGAPPGPARPRAGEDKADNTPRHNTPFH